MEDERDVAEVPAGFSILVCEAELKAIRSHLGWKGYKQVIVFYISSSTAEIKV